MGIIILIMLQKKLLTLALVIGLSALAIYSDYLIDQRNQLQTNIGNSQERPLRRYEITAEKLQELLDTDSKLTIIDIRSKKEYQTGHIKSSIFISANELNAPKLTAMQIDQLDRLIIYGETELKANVVRRKLETQGYLNVQILRGGINEWIALGYSVED